MCAAIARTVCVKHGNSRYPTHLANCGCFGRNIANDWRSESHKSEPSGWIAVCLDRTRQVRDGGTDSPGDCFNWELSPHLVEIKQGFWIGETEVTQQAYQRVTGKNPSLYRGLRLPVDQVGWDDAKRYCEKVGMKLPVKRNGSSQAGEANTNRATDQYKRSPGSIRMEGIKRTKSPKSSPTLLGSST